MCDTKAMVGFDVVIVCTSNESGATYWQRRLSGGRGIVPEKTTIVAVHEDWEGGAGNGLGTLYAFLKAERVVKKTLDRSLMEEMRRKKISVGLFHTAGKGTRLAPLPGSECNNKPGVKLPSVILVDGKAATVTILESVIRQTGVYAASRAGRLSVFWGDQIFVPAIDTRYVPTHHADILCMLGTFPNEKEWAARGLEKYGLIAVNAGGDAFQIEKVTHATARAILSDVGTLVAAGTSLGSFSVSHDMLRGLMSEFDKELSAKKGKFDTDPHFWMPLTLPRDGYVRLMERKGTSSSDATAHWNRMRDFATREFKDVKHLFGAVSVGESPYWWDYGQLKYYVSNNLKLTDASSAESAAMRTFFHVPTKQSSNGSFVDDASKLSSSVKLSGGTVCLSSSIGRGRVEGCVVVNCEIGHLEASNSVLVDVTAPSVRIVDGVVYNVSEEKSPLSLSKGDVVVDVTLPGNDDESHRVSRLMSHVSVCGGKHWKKTVGANDMTFEDVYLKNKNSDISASLRHAAALRRKASKGLNQ